MVVNYSSQQKPLDNERENHTKGAVKEERTTKTTSIPLLSSSTRRIAHTPNNAQHSLPQQQQQHPVPKSSREGEAHKKNPTQCNKRKTDKNNNDNIRKKQTKHFLLLLLRLLRLSNLHCFWSFRLQ
jgi:hypothetical protein